MKKVKDTPRPQSEEDVDDFLKQVELLNECSYLKMRTSDVIYPKIKLKLEKNDNKVTTTIEGFPERESIEAFLMRIRPLVVYEEPLYIGKVATFVFKGKGLEAEKRLQLYRNGIARREESLYSVRIDGKEYSSQQFIWLHLYGKYFHLDREKRQLLKNLKEKSGWLVLTEATSLGTLEIYATIATFLAQDILKMRAGKPFENPPNIELIK